jgi:hypothetical protein
MVSQGDIYKARENLIIGRCRPMKGDLFWVTTPAYKNAEFCSIARKGKGSLGSGYQVSIAQLNQYFEKVM